MTMPHEPDMGLCDCATLYSSDESYWLVDNRQHATDRCVCIDRATGGVTFQESLPNTDFFDSSHRQEIHGLLGVIDLLSGPHLVVITERRRIGKIYQHMLWEVTDTAILPYARHRRHLADVQCRIEDRYLDMLSTALNTHRMYLSYTYDITHSLQNLLTNGDEFYARTLYNRMEPRFCWNQYILKGLARHPEFSRYLLPVICGFVAVSHSANVNGRNLQFTLISRRSVQRTGTRFNRRGKYYCSCHAATDYLQHFSVDTSVDVYSSAVLRWICCATNTNVYKTISVATTSSYLSVFFTRIPWEFHCCPTHSHVSIAFVI
eukprot:m.880732 g.880732  ORF g.880732 m.880732 type:complete len:319 (+) comp23593_c0_seq11:190-1146(+)